MKGLFEVHCVEETWALARRFAAGLKPGDVVCLEGDLGAGKTTFMQGLASAMGVKGRVTSPTFCIVQEHRTAVPESPSPDARSQSPDTPSFLVHMDLYRLHGEDDVIAIGWEDYLAEGAVLVVEWSERAGSLIPAEAHHIEFHHLGADDESRRIEFK